MAGIIILLTFVCFLIAILVMPIHLRVNREGKRSYADKPALLKLNIDLDGTNLVTVIWNVLYLRFTWYPLQRTVRSPVSDKTQSNEKRIDLPEWNKLKFALSIAWQSAEKSTINELYLDLDTGNVIINAHLFPVFELMSERPRIDLNVNYVGNFALVLDFQNNILNLLRTVIKNLFKRSFISSKIK
jgi:hypothetical protein